MDVSAHGRFGQTDILTQEYQGTGKSQHRDVLASWTFQQVSCQNVRCRKDPKPTIICSSLSDTIILKSSSNVGCSSIAAAAASPSLSCDRKLPSSTTKNQCSRSRTILLTIPCLESAVYAKRIPYLIVQSDKISLKSSSNVGCSSVAAAAASPSLSRDGKLPSSTPKNQCSRSRAASGFQQVGTRLRSSKDRKRNHFYPVLCITLSLFKLHCKCLQIKRSYLIELHLKMRSNSQKTNLPIVGNTALGVFGQLNLYSIGIVYARHYNPLLI